MTFSPGTWAFSKAEGFFTDGGFASRADAIRAGIERYEDRDFFTGQCKPLEWTQSDADRLARSTIENLQQYMHDNNTLDDWDEPYPVFAPSQVDSLGVWIYNEMERALAVHARFTIEHIQHAEEPESRALVPGNVGPSESAL